MKVLFLRFNKNLIDALYRFCQSGIWSHSPVPFQHMYMHSYMNPLIFNIHIFLHDMNCGVWRVDGQNERSIIRPFRHSIQQFNFFFFFLLGSLCPNAASWMLNNEKRVMCHFIWYSALDARKFFLFLFFSYAMT